jgi:hypothetical protein
LHCGPRCDFNVDCYDSTWQWYNEPCRVCASPETQISTPEGERAIAALTVGDVVFSVDHGEIVAVPLIRVSSMPVSHHHMMRVALENGRVLSISPGHPTWDGRTFADLVAGSRLDERFRVVDAELVPYEYDHTYDILPDSDTGTYFAEGALIGSTLFTPNVPPQWSRDGSGSIPLEATAASSPPAHVPPAGSAGLSRAPRKPAARP